MNCNVSLFANLLLAPTNGKVPRFHIVRCHTAVDCCACATRFLASIRRNEDHSNDCTLQSLRPFTTLYIACLECAAADLYNFPDQRNLPVKVQQMPPRPLRLVPHSCGPLDHLARTTNYTSDTTRYRKVYKLSIASSPACIRTFLQFELDRF